MSFKKSSVKRISSIAEDATDMARFTTTAGEDDKGWHSYSLSSVAPRSECSRPWCHYRQPTHNGWPRYSRLQSRLLPTASAAGCCSVSNVWGGKVTGQCIYQQQPRLLQLSLLYGITDTQLQRLQSEQNAATRLVTGTRRSQHITPMLRSLTLVASTPAYHVQGRYHCSQMSKRPCPSVPVQRPTVGLCWSAPDRHALCHCQRGPTGSSEVTNYNRWTVFIQHRWTTSLENCLLLFETNSSLRFRKLLKAFLCLTAMAPVGWHL